MCGSCKWNFYLSFQHSRLDTHEVKLKNNVFFSDEDQFNFKLYLYKVTCVFKISRNKFLIISGNFLSILTFIFFTVS
jgi:hypothetical protein